MSRCVNTSALSLGVVGADGIGWGARPQECAIRVDSIDHPVLAALITAPIILELTLNNEYEVHTFQEARRLRDNYTRRLMYHFPGARILIYMGRGKGTHRIHFHMVSEGIPEDMITKLWGMGEIVRIEHLREHNYYSGIDHGQDYTGLANYLFDHWTPEQGGHRWKKAGKLDKPDREPSTEVKRNYTENKPPRPPKGYILVESKATKYGYLYYKYVRQPEPPKKARRKKAGSG